MSRRLAALLTVCAAIAVCDRVAAGERPASVDRRPGALVNAYRSQAGDRPDAARRPIEIGTGSRTDPPRPSSADGQRHRDGAGPARREFQEYRLPLTILVSPHGGGA